MTPITFAHHRVYGDAVTRAPLVFPTCYTCPTPTSYDQTLPASPSLARDFLRGSFWSVVVPGLPFVPGNVPWSGGSLEHPERLVQGLDYKYDRREWWPRMVAENAARGYTHWLRWWGNARVDGGNSEEQFVDDCLYLKSLGVPYVKVWLWAKDADPHDLSADDLKRRFESIVGKLCRANAVDEFTPGGEWNLGNVPGRPTIDFFKWVGQQAHGAGASCWAHFSTEVTSWFADGDPRGRYGFWDDLGGDVDGIDYQAVPVTFNEPIPPDGSRWDIGEFQSRLVDTLKQFGEQGNRHKIRACEFSAILSFVGDYPDEDQHDALGFLACCTRASKGAVVWGSGDGVRMPDGTAI